MATVTKTIKPGGTPGSDCDYTSISSALAANCGLASKDLVSQTTSVVLNCVAGSGADTSSVNTNGWTCNSAYNLTIRGYDTGKHAGKYDATKYIIRPTSGHVVSLGSAFDLVQDLILDLQNTTSYACGVTTGTASGLYHFVRRCIIRKSGTGSNQKGVWAEAAGVYLTSEHCIVYGQSGKAFAVGGGVGQNSCTVNMYNCTVYNCSTGFWVYSGYASPYNCLIASCTTCFSGTSGTNCASTDATAGTYKNITPGFTDAANEDFHLAGNPWSGTDITTLSPAGVALDIDGQTVTTWLVGADSVPGPAGGSTQDASHTASGGATSGGGADISREAVTLGSGGATTGGAASTSSSSVGPQEASHVASGGAVTGGDAASVREAGHVASGGAVAGGAAAASSGFDTPAVHDSGLSFAPVARAVALVPRATPSLAGVLAARPVNVVPVARPVSVTA